MKKPTKRIVSLLCALLMLAALLSGCGSNTEEEQALLQEQWAACLETYDQAYAYMLWAFDYAEQFAGDNSWESLQKARAACSSALLALEQLEFPEEKLTMEQYQTLMEDGIEAEVVSQELVSLETEITYQLNTMTNLLYLLRDDVYLTASARTIPDWVAAQRESIRLSGSYLCLTTNYLLLQMKDRTLWDEMGERFPVVGACCGSWNAKKDALQLEADSVLDKLETLLTDAAEMLAVSEYTLMIVQEAVDTGDYANLAAELNVMADIPACFPLPSWLPQETMWYYLVTEDGTEEKRLVQAGEELTQVPSACYIRCDGITMENMESYEQQLSYWAVEHLAEQTEDGAYQIFAVIGDCALLIEWEEDAATVYLSEPVGCLMPELYLAALQMR